MTCPHEWIPPQSCPLCKDAEIERLTLENGKIANTLGAENLRLRAALTTIATMPSKPNDSIEYARCQNIAKSAISNEQ